MRCVSRTEDNWQRNVENQASKEAENMLSVCNASEDRLHNGNNNLLYATRDGFFFGKEAGKEALTKEERRLFTLLQSFFSFCALNAFMAFCEKEGIFKIFIADVGFAKISSHHRFRRISVPFTFSTTKLTKNL